jgi:hypothetical protein
LAGVDQQLHGVSNSGSRPADTLGESPQFTLRVVQTALRQVVVPGQLGHRPAGVVQRRELTRRPTRLIPNTTNKKAPKYGMVTMAIIHATVATDSRFFVSKTNGNRVNVSK